MDEAKYVIRIFFEWGGGCLWSGSDSTTKQFGYGPLDLEPCSLPLSRRVIKKCKRLARWHDKSLNRDYPPDPGPWRQPECDKFNEAVANLLTSIRSELGNGFEIVDKQNRLREDPDLDAYLADPKGFQRMV